MQEWVRHQFNCSGGARRCWIKQQHLELHFGNTILITLSWKNEWRKCSTPDYLRIYHHISWAQHHFTKRRNNLLYLQSLRENLILTLFFTDWMMTSLFLCNIVMSEITARVIHFQMDNITLLSQTQSRLVFWLILCSTAFTAVSPSPLQHSCAHR